VAGSMRVQRIFVVVYLARASFRHKVYKQKREDSRLPLAVFED